MSEKLNNLEFETGMECLFRDALVKYASHETGERSDLVDHADRVASLVNSFAGKLIPEEAIATVYLHDVVDRFANVNSGKYNPEREAVAREVLTDVFSDPMMSLEQGNYCSAILADMVTIETASGKHRRDMAPSAKNGNNNGITSEVQGMITDKYNGQIPPDVWKKTEPLIDFDHMRRHIKDVNLESLIIKACELVDNMRHPSSSRESALFQDVLEAESYYAPIIEALGLEGLAGLLRSEAHKRRLVGQGKSDCVEAARSVHDGIVDAGIISIVGQLFDDDSRSYILPAVKEDSATGEPPVYIGEFVTQTTSDTMISGNYRLKAIGSLANKINRYGGEKLPMDTVGLMVISSDSKQSAIDFANFIEKRVDMFDLYPAESKTHPIFIQGSEEYVANVESELGSRGVDPSSYQTKAETRQEAERDGFRQYEVSKVTFMVKNDGEDIPVEVQFITRDERRRSRLGEVAHIIYKYLSQFEDISNQDRKAVIASAVETLQDVYDRKKHLNPNSLDVNERSIARSDALLAKIVL